MKAFANIIAAMALTVSTAVIAAPASVSVKTSDINLATDAGQKALAQRIDRAAKQLCAAEALSQSPDMIRAERRCVEATKQSVQQQVAARTGILAAVK
jgi:UrcA family protein